MLNDLLQQFLQSQQGAEAMQTLQQQHGLSPDQAHNAIQAVASGTGDELTQQMGNPQDPNAPIPLMSNMGNAGLGGLAAILAGQGLGGALKGAIGGAVAGRVAQEIARRTGMNPSTASTIAAAATPFLIKFLQERMGGQQQPGGNGQMNMPQQFPQQGGFPGIGMPNMAPPMGGGAMPGGKPAMAPNAKTPVGQGDGWENAGAPQQQVQPQQPQQHDKPDGQGKSGSKPPWKRLL